MNVDEELNHAIQERIAKENAFFNLIKIAIKEAVDKFDLCDTSTSPEVEESVYLSKDRLTEAIRKLKDETNLNKAETDIKGWFLDLAQKNNLVQDSNYVTNSNYFAPTATPVAPVASAAPIVNGVPAPRSFIDGAKRWFRPSNGDSRWIGNDSFPVGPVYQAEPYHEKSPDVTVSQPFNQKRLNSFGGKRKTRKYRRKV